jgi:protein TonB
VNLVWGTDRDRRQYAQSWAVSLAAHGVILSAAIGFLADLKFIPLEERFRWEVSVVEPPPPPQPKQVEEVREVQPEQQPVIQKVQQVIKREIKETKPLQQLARAATETAQVVTRTAQTVVQHAQTVVEAAPVTSTTAPSAVQAPAAVEAPAITQARSVTGSVSAVQEPVQEAAVKALPAQPLRGPERPIEQASIKELPVRAAPSTRPDYGWLMDALWRQVDRLKRYPHTARLNRWEGKVVVRAVVRDDGQVVDLSVEESSGHTVLDRDALEILKQASPLKLKYPLGQSQVVVHVPISYKLQ